MTSTVKIKIEPDEISEKNQINETLSVKLQDLERTIKTQKEISNKFNKELNEYKVKVQKEKKALIKEHRTEVKYWRKELGEEITLKLKLEEKLDEKSHESIPCVTLPTALSHLVSTPQLHHPPSLISDIICSICGNPIENYIPKYFLGEEINAACNNCKEKTNSLNDTIEDVTESDEARSTPEQDEGFDKDNSKDTIATGESLGNPDGSRVPASPHDEVIKEGNVTQDFQNNTDEVVNEMIQSSLDQNSPHE